MKTPAIEVKTRVRGLKKLRQEEYLKVEHERLQGADFSGRKLKSLTAIGSKFIACKFERMRIDGGSFGAGREISEYVDCSFDGSRIRMGVIGYVRFEHCSFRNTDLRDWICFSVEVVNCSFNGRMAHSIFNGTPRDDQLTVVQRKRNEFRGNDFSEMKLEDVAFRTGVDLTQQRLPTGLGYVYLRNAENALRNARAEILCWKDMELRRQSMNWITSLEEEIKNGQQQLLLRADDYPKSLRKSTDAVLDVLRKYAERS